MSRDLPTPPVPELARAKGETVGELVDYFTEYYNRQSAVFNYRLGTKAVRSAYKGIHKLHLLTASCVAERTAIGRSANTEVVNNAAPFAFGRMTQVFDLSPRKFAFGRDHFSAYRVPFFFVESGVVKAYFLQPRKSASLNVDDLAMVATIVRDYLLRTEFYGLKCDVEFVDVSALAGSKIRAPRIFSLDMLPLWSEKRIADRLTTISEALDIVASSGVVVERRRVSRKVDPEMPLFD